MALASGDPAPGRWRRVGYCAGVRGISRSAMLRSLKRIDRRAGGKVLRRDEGQGWWWVDLDALVLHAKPSQEQHVERWVQDLAARVEEVEIKQLALRNSHRKLKQETAGKFQGLDARFVALEELLEAHRRFAVASLRG